MRTEEERWQQFKKEFARKNMIVNSEWGVIDCSPNAMEDNVIKLRIKESISNRYTFFFVKRLDK